jgi:hypothetical protein
MNPLRRSVGSIPEHKGRHLSERPVRVTRERAPQILRESHHYAAWVGLRAELGRGTSVASVSWTTDLDRP